ncbi:hypothetical protein JX265_013381 [Neoarthrinium moseri]|uniref:Nudix hydrolase domain-containing protein n=1 Tax=Neoarthrinium moseri TaxID=1658444 RepID=A0A9P9W8R6_9PEZI|nr:hypothetical protein JX266_012895 [Neoarthrinium moseri]KAI1850489.1 hypothetical protein JX265_013381 [Neoarthrinium moseri]
MGPTLTSGQKNILAMSKAEYLTQVDDSDSGTRLQVTAAIFRVDVQSSRPTILLLKRRSHDLHSPGAFEIPSGRVDDGDFFISDSIARAVKKQASLKVIKVLGMLREGRWVDRHSWLEDDDIKLTVTQKTVQLNWAVSVDSSDEVVVRGDDFEEFVWANWNALGALNLKDDVRDLAKEALTWAARCLC